AGAPRTHRAAAAGRPARRSERAMPPKLPPVQVLLKESPSNLTENCSWLLKVIESWHEYMRRGSLDVPDNWRVKLCGCVERAGLQADRVGLHSLLGRRPSLIAHKPEAILRYLRLCQQTAAAADPVPAN